MKPLNFSTDYLEGAHPLIIKALTETNLLQTPGYGTDRFCESASEKIRSACNAPDAEIHFLSGGTQTNAILIDALLQSYQGVIAADSGHISVHEAGAIELTGHKVITLPNTQGKLSAAELARCCESYRQDQNRDHMVMPGMVYISQPTEFGTLYSLVELKEISRICRSFHIPLYVDGARLAYALACKQNNVTLEDLAKLCDVFYIGGTKCGALFGEAIVIPKPGLIPHLFTQIKQHGALLAKGRILGIQFDTLFTDRLYLRIGEPAISAADRLRTALQKSGFALTFDSPTNQIFVTLENSRLARWSEHVTSSFWETADENHSTIRLATSWATTAEDVDAFVHLIESGVI